MNLSRKVENPEILEVVKRFADEQGLTPENVFEALENALQTPALLKYGKQNDIQVVIDRKTGSISFYRRLHVVAEPTNPYAEISLQEAHQTKLSAQMGDILVEELPGIDLDRIAAQLSRGVIVDKIKETKRALHFEEYKHRIGDLIQVVVKRNEITYVLVEFENKVEGIIRKNDLLPGEKLQVGERIWAVISDVRPESAGPVVLLSRTNNQFLKELLRREVTEIDEGIIDVKAAARIPGSRAKVAVYAPDPSVDAVGACIGIKGSRIQVVSNELMGEKIDVIQWSSDPAKFVVNALAPADIAKVIIDEDRHIIEVIVPENQKPLVFGRGRQNIRLATMITGWRINVETEENESKRASAEKERICKHFMETLNVDEMMGYLLAAEGYSSVEQLSFESLDELANLEGFDYDLAKVLKDRAESYYNNQRKKFMDEWETQNVDKNLISYEHLSFEQKSKLIADDVKSLKDLAYLSADELLEILNDDTTLEDANDMIMALRKQYLGIGD